MKKRELTAEEVLHFYVDKHQWNYESVENVLVRFINKKELVKEFKEFLSKEKY